MTKECVSDQELINIYDKISKKTMDIETKIGETSGAVVFSACVHSALRLLGLPSSIVLGAATYKDFPFWHAWVESNGAIIDPSIGPTLKGHGVKGLDVGTGVFLNREEERIGIRYYHKREIPEWYNSPLREIEGKSVFSFLDRAGIGAYEITLELAGLEINEQNVSKLRSLILYDAI